MKKLLILALVLVVAGGLFAQAAAPAVTFSGQMQYGTISSTDSKYLFTGSYLYWLLRWDIAATENTKTVWRMRAKGELNGTPVAGSSTTAGPNPAYAIPHYAFVESNILGEFGIKDIKYIVNIGIDDHDSIDLAAPVSPAGVASVDYFDFYGWGYENTISIMNMVNIRAIFAPNSWATNLGGWGIATDGAFGPIAFNVAYSTALTGNTALALQQLAAQSNFSSDPAKGMFQFGVRFSQEVAKDIPLMAYAGISQNLNKEQTRWGVAAKVGYQTLATLALGAMGFNKAKAGTGQDAEDSWFNRMEVRAVVMPVSAFSLDVGSTLNIDKERYVVTTGEKSMLNDLDIRANLHANKTTTFSVGYLLLGGEGYYSMLANEIGRVGHKAQGLGGLYFEAFMKW